MTAEVILGILAVVLMVTEDNLEVSVDPVFLKEA